MDFEAIMNHCANTKRKGEAGTWINDALIEAYLRLYNRDIAKCVGVYKNDELVGGLYGVDLPEKGIFCGESMFSLATDASKIALWFLTERLIEKNYRLIDAQIYNDHLASLGAVTIDREVFLSYLAE